MYLDDDDHIASFSGVLTQREAVENRLMKLFPGVVVPLTEKEIPVINAHKDGTFGRSFLSYSLYNNGHNPHSESRQCPRGLLYNDGDTIFGIGVFFRKEEPDKRCISIVAPHGNNSLKALERFCTKVEQTMPGTMIYARQLTLEQTRALVKLDLDLILERTALGENGYSWKRVDYAPWTPGASEEDETHEACLVDFSKVISDSKFEGFNNIPWLRAESRSQARHKYTRFSRFLKRYDLEFTFERYSPDKRYQVSNETSIQSHEGIVPGRLLARNIVGRHFQRLREKGKAIGSTPYDYHAIIDTSPDSLPDGMDILIGFIGKKGQPETRRPVSFFAFEDIGLLKTPDLPADHPGKRTYGNYAGIALYDHRCLGSLIPQGPTPPVGYSCIMTYAQGMLFRYLKEKGVEQGHLGGSETGLLNGGKKQIGAIDLPMNWLVRIENERWKKMLGEDAAIAAR